MNCPPLALAQRGFERLGPELDRASSDSAPLEVRFRETMAGSVAFAADHPELFDLMFARKRAGATTTFLRGNAPAT